MLLTQSARLCAVFQMSSVLDDAAEGQTIFDKSSSSLWSTTVADSKCGVPRRMSHQCLYYWLEVVFWWSGEECLFMAGLTFSWHPRNKIVQSPHINPALQAMGLISILPYLLCFYGEQFFTVVANSVAWLAITFNWCGSHWAHLGHHIQVYQPQAVLWPSKWWPYTFVLCQSALTVSRTFWFGGGFDFPYHEI